MTPQVLQKCLCLSGLLLLAACGDGDRDFGGPLEKRSQPVDLVLLEDGRPAPDSSCR